MGVTLACGKDVSRINHIYYNGVRLIKLSIVYLLGEGWIGLGWIIVAKLRQGQFSIYGHLSRYGTIIII